MSPSVTLFAATPMNRVFKVATDLCSAVLPASTLSIVLAAVAVYVAIRFLRAPAARSARNAVASEERRILITMLQLCQDSYRSATRVVHFPIVNFNFVEAQEWGAVSLYKHQSREDWVVVIRGTQYLYDVYQDWRLVTDSIGRTRAVWTTDANRMAQRVRALLEAATRGGSGETVVFVGHSLGASYAEYLLHHFRSNPIGSVAFNSAVTFDSPGQPQQLRQEIAMPIPLPGLITLNAAPNAVNTLNTPCAERLYSCEMEFNLSLLSAVESWSIATRAVPGAFVASFLYRLIRNNTLTHQLEHLHRHLERDEVAHRYNNAWPSWTQDIGRRLLGNSYRAVIPTSRPHRHSSRQQRVSATQVAEALPPGITAMPNSREEMDLRVPYAFPLGQVEARWKQFTGADGPGILEKHDSVFIVIGQTSAGKTCIVKHITGRANDDSLLAISSDTNTTLVPTVFRMGEVKIQTPKGSTTSHLYLIDMPGGGAEGRAPEDGWAFDSAAELLRKVGCACTIFFVQKGIGLTNQELRYFQGMKQFVETRTTDSRMVLRVIWNDDDMTDPDRDATIEKLSILLEIPVTSISRCRALNDHRYPATRRSINGHNMMEVDELWKKAILSESIEKNGNFAGQHRYFPEWKFFTLPRSNLEAGRTIGVTAGTGIVTYATGAGWWAAAGLAGGSTAVFGMTLVPAAVVVTLASGAATHCVQRSWKWAHSQD